MKQLNQLRIAKKSLLFAYGTNRTLFLTLILLHLFQGSIVYLQFTSFASIVDEIILIKSNNSGLDNLIQSSIFLGVSFILPSITGNLVSYYMKKFRLLQDINLNLEKIEKQSSLDISTLESSSYQNLLRSANEWGTGSVLKLQEFVFTSTSHIAGIITSIVVLYSLNKFLVLFAILAAAPIYFFYNKFNLEVFRVRMFSLEDNRIITDRMSHFQNLNKAIDVILLNLKVLFKEQVKDKMLNYNTKVIRAERRMAVSNILMSVWYLIFLFTAIALMTFGALEGKIQVGSLLLAFSTYTKFYQTINSFIESVSHSEDATRYAAKWFELFDLNPRVSSASNAQKVMNSSKRPPVIEFKGVSFSYPDDSGDSSRVLKNVSLTINSGEKVALVGQNGSGKSTFIKLLARIYDPTEGSILINGVNLKDINLVDWRNSLGILFQDFPTYNMTINESISLGRLTLKSSDEFIKKAARNSGSHQFINKLPNDYNQLIWKEFKTGVELSKGEHQRLAVARIFYRNAPITILDEPTASIDAMTEEKIFNSLETNMDDKTLILVTHRFGSIKNVDKIILMNDGELAGLGSHKELFAQNELYSKLYNVQANRYTSSMRQKLN